MAEEKDGPSGFKVVDRRSFASDGTRVSGQPQQKEESRDEQQQVRAKAAETPQTAPPADSESSERFAMLVSYLSTTAMFQLGLLPGPGGEYIPADLANGSRTIDLLEVLQEKTRGNLTRQESNLLDDVLYELRMTYLEVQKQASKRK